MDDDLIEEFLAETSEALSELDVDIVSLEQNPNDEDLIGKIFRLVHTVKGTCGFLGLPRLETVAHHGENVLGRFRDKDLQVTPEYVTLILEAFDRIKDIVAAIAETGSEPEGDDSELLQKLDDAYNFGKGEVMDDGMVDLMQMSMEDLAAQADADKNNIANTEEPIEAKESNDIEEKDDASKSKDVASPANQSLRVNVQVLEDLMTMVSELVLTRNQLIQILRSHTDSEFSAPLQRLNQVVSELQEGVMKTRMQPIGNAWGKLPRIIRDIGVELNKTINLEMRGQDTELDRQVLDLIKDPLMHMVRNSGDHGIETPEERLAAGKSEAGHILLNAYHEGGHIIIEISDDGKGLSTDRIKAKVLANGLATKEELEQMSDQQIHQYIFNAGLSTAEKVTSVSGRGVGMDVVRSNVEKIGGTIELKSIEGKGSVFTIKIPLTLAIVSALIVEVAGERYAIPQLSVQELVRTSENSSQKIEKIKGTAVLRLRDRLLPLITLSKLLKSASGDISSNDNDEQIIDEYGNTKEVEAELDDIKGQNYIVVTQVGSYSFGIVVDKVFDTEEIVVKPVPQILKDIGIYAGNTILGDGSVIMILDPNGIATASASEASFSNDLDIDAGGADENITTSERKTSLLVFRAGQGALKAVPLSLVSRLEDIDVAIIEEINHCKVVQYRGQLMPIVPFNDKIPFKDKGHQSILVFSENNKSMGLMVDEIVDIVEEVIDVQLGGMQPEILGSAIIDKQAMDVIDVGHFLGTSNQDNFAASGSSGVLAEQGHEQSYKVLVVDDSNFFQEMLTPLLSVAGYKVVSVTNAKEALSLHNANEVFDVIISDIEMPEINGFEFVQKIKSADSKWKDIPAIALSAHTSPKDVEKGLNSGFDRYIMKFDKDGLLNAIKEVMTEVEQSKMGDAA